MHVIIIIMYITWTGPQSSTVLPVTLCLTVRLHQLRAKRELEKRALRHQPLIMEVGWELLSYCNWTNGALFGNLPLSFSTFVYLTHNFHNTIALVVEVEEKPPSAKKVKKEKKKKIKVEEPAEEEVGEQGSPPIQAPCRKLTYIYMYMYTYISMATRSHPTYQCNRSHMQKFVFHFP